MGSLADLAGMELLALNGEAYKMSGEFHSSPVKGQGISTGYLSKTNPKSTASPLDLMKAIQRNLSIELNDYLHSDIDLLPFVHTVFGLPVEEGQKILSATFSILPKELDEYRAATLEKKLHQPFIKIATQLLTDAIKIIGKTPQEPVRIGYWDRKGNKPLIENGRRRKPDLLGLWLPVPDEKETPVWAETIFSVEFKLQNAPGTVKNNITSGGPAGASSQQADHVPEQSAKGKRKGKRKGKGGKGKGKRPRDPDEGSLDRGKDPTQEQVSKRVRLDTWDEQHGEDEQREEEKVDEPEKQHGDDDDRDLTNGEVQLGTYALEGLASTCRYWVPGLLVQRTAVTVCYFDRHLVACASTFSFDASPGKLALILYALNRCDKVQAGFDPHLLPWSSSGNTRATKSRLAELSRPVKAVVGSYLEYSEAELEGKEEEGYEDPDTPICLRITDVIRRPDDLISRGTTVFQVVRRLSAGAFSTEKYAFKLSSPLARRKSEYNIVKILKTRLPEQSHRHFPLFLFAICLTSEDIKLPWHNLPITLTERNHQDRVIRGLLGKLYRKLWEVGNLENYKKVFLDCVEVHHLAFYSGSVIHRDVSEENLMLYQDEAGNIIGVLNDWDMAKFLDDPEDMLTAAHHRTGSPPFMALDLLGTEKTPHFFRHELEAFYHVLVWSCIQYNLKERTRDRYVNNAIIGWTRSKEENLAAKLKLYAGAREGIKPLRNSVKEEFLPLWDEWVVPLHKFFSRARNQYFDDEEEGVAGEYATLGDRVTFKKFMKALKGTDNAYRKWGNPHFLDNVA